MTNIMYLNDPTKTIDHLHIVIISGYNNGGSYDRDRYYGAFPEYAQAYKVAHDTLCIDYKQDSSATIETVDSKSGRVTDTYTVYRNSIRCE